MHLIGAHKASSTNKSSAWIILGETRTGHPRTNILYKNTYIKTGDFYIGSSINGGARIRNYEVALSGGARERTKCPVNKKMYALAEEADFNSNAFSLEVLLLLPDITPLTELRALEQVYIDNLAPTLNSKNSTTGGVGGEGYVYGKAIHRFSLDRVYQVSYPSSILAGIDVNLASSVIRECALGYFRQAGGYLWSYNKDVLPIYSCIPRKELRIPNRYKFEVKTNSGLFVGEYSDLDSLLLSFPQCNRDRIQDTLMGKSRSTGGYLFNPVLLT